jgi:hypothetical protein
LTFLQKGTLVSSLTGVGVMLERSEASQGGVDSAIFTFLHLGQSSNQGNKLVYLFV